MITKSKNGHKNETHLSVRLTRDAILGAVLGSNISVYFI
jgi:hypothetical protein